MDRHVAATAHKVGPGQLQRLVDEAIGTFMPDLAEERRLAKADGRYFTIESQPSAFDGTVPVHGQLDLADAMDLEERDPVGRGQLKDLGSTDSLDVRRSIAVGELARRQLALDFSDGSVVEEGAPRPSRNHRRELVLYVHLSQDALTARLEHGNQLDHPRPTPPVVRRRRPGDRQTGPRPERARPGRLTGRARPARRARRRPRPDLRLPLVHPDRTPLRHRPHHPAQPRRSDLSVQRGRSLSKTSPDQDPRRLDLHDPRNGHLPLAEPARLPVPARSHRQPRPHPTLTTPPRTPPDQAGPAACAGPHQGPRQARPTLARRPAHSHRVSRLGHVAPRTATRCMTYGNPKRFTRC